MLLLASALLTASLGDFLLESGQVLKDLKLCYRTYGTRNADSSNVVLFPTWFNGKTENLETYISGTDPFVDASEFFVVAVDAIGNGNSTSPTNSRAQKGKAFPRFTIGDMVRSQHLLLSKELGIHGLHAVVGISMGGMQAFEWMARYPSFVKHGVSIVGTPRMTGADMALWIEMGMEQAGKAKGGGGSGNLQATLLSALGGLLGQRGGGSSIPRPENALAQFNAMARHNATQHFENSLSRTAQGIRARVLLFIAEKDQAVSGEIPNEFARLSGARRVILKDPSGHNAYKVERKLISGEVLPFLKNTRSQVFH